MHKLHTLLVTAALASAAWGAAAQTLKPGLWEINNKMTSSGETGKAMAQAQQQMAGLPPEQRKMMESMMAKQGVGMGSDGAMVAKVCMTQEMIDHDEVANQQGDCKHSTSPRTGNTMKFSFVCTKPPSNGEGQVTFVSPQAYTLKMALTTSAHGQPEKMTLDSSARFLDSACGNIKPLVGARQK